MFRSRTLFVVGAGASSEVRLPIGRGLTERIAELVDITFAHGNLSPTSGELEIYNCYKRAAEVDKKLTAEGLRRAGVKLAQAMPLTASIDNYLDAHQESSEVIVCGKLGIARAILDAEKRSDLYFDPRYGSGGIFTDAKHTWYVRFFRMLVSDIPKRQVDEVLSNVSFIIFNYDRCVEHFLRYALATYYDLDEQLANEIVGRAKIIHPYGSLGDLPESPRDHEAVPFGGHETANDYYLIQRDIHTFTEALLSDETRLAIRSEVSAAQQIVFLGFSYQKQNMKLLAGNCAATKVFGTAFGLSEEDMDAIKRSVMNSFNSRPADFYINVKPLRCAEFFDAFSMALPE